MECFHLNSDYQNVGGITFTEMPSLLLCLVGIRKGVVTKCPTCSVPAVPKKLRPTEVFGRASLIRLVKEKYFAGVCSDVCGLRC